MAGYGRLSAAGYVRPEPPTPHGSMGVASIHGRLYTIIGIFVKGDVKKCCPKIGQHCRNHCRMGEAAIAAPRRAVDRWVYISVVVMLL